MSEFDYYRALRQPFVKVARLEFLQPDNTVAFALDNLGSNSKSKAFIQEGSLTVNLQNGRRRVATVTLDNVDNQFDYNVNNLWFGQRIRLMEGMILPNGAEYLLPQGVFYIVNPEETFTPTKRTVKLNLNDKWSYLDGTLFGRLDGIYEVTKGNNIFTAIQSLLDLPTGNGQVVDNVRPIFTEYYNSQTSLLPSGERISDLLMPYDFRCDSDTGSYADIILEMNKILAGWIGYDAEGRLRLDPSQDDILDTTKPIMWNFSPSEITFLGATYTSKNSDVFNDVIITGEALDEYKNVSGRATNYDLSSDTNVNLIGKKTYRETAAGYASRRQCEDLAVFKLKRQTILHKSVSIECSQLFHIQENQLVTITREDKPGSPIERHLVNGFTRPIGQTGKMTIQATSVQDFPIATITQLPWE